MRSSIRKGLRLLKTLYEKLEKEINRPSSVVSLNEKISLIKKDIIENSKVITAMDAYIAVRGSDNIFEMSGVAPEKLSQAMRAMKPVLDHRVNKTKWVILRWPTAAMAQQALMSTESFEEFFFRVCTQDYSRMSEGMLALIDSEGQVSVATVMSVTLSVDHRVIDGALGAELLKAIVDNLENPMGMLA